MTETSLSDFRSHADRYFDLVEAGEPVRIIRDGKSIADLIPIAEYVPSWKRRVTTPLVIEGCSISKMVLEEPESYYS